MDLIKTHLLLAEEDEKQIKKNNFLSNSNSLNGFWDGANLMGILNTIGGTWSQIEQAKNGKPVYIKSPSGDSKDIAPLLLQKLEEQAKAQQTSVDNLMKMMQMQMQNHQEKPQKDNTLLYVGISAGVLVLLGGIYVITKK